MANKLMYIPSDDTQYYPLFEMFRAIQSKFTKVPKVVKPTRKRYHKTFETSAINSPCPFSLLLFKLTKRSNSYGQTDLPNSINIKSAMHGMN